MVKPSLGCIVQNDMGQGPCSLTHRPTARSACWPCAPWPPPQPPQGMSWQPRGTWAAGAHVRGVCEGEWEHKRAEPRTPAGQVRACCAHAGSQAPKGDAVYGEGSQGRCESQAPHLLARPPVLAIALQGVCPMLAQRFAHLGQQGVARQSASQHRFDIVGANRRCCADAGSEVAMRRQCP